MNLDTESFNIDLLHMLLIAAVIFLSITVARTNAGNKKAEPKNTDCDAKKEVELNPEINTDTNTDRVRTTEAKAKKAAMPMLESANSDSALQLLSILQQEARFIDFTQEDLTAFSDAEIGAVARVVHEGSKKALANYITLSPIANQAEETAITVPVGFNPAHYRLTGNVVGEAPFNGTLIHRGWQVIACELPKIVKGHNTAILTPAEVEL